MFGDRIKRIVGREVLNSRGEWTLEIEVHTKKVFGRAIVPSGKSRGIHEAVYIENSRALKILKEYVEPHLIGMDPRDQKGIDEKLIILDGTENKSRIGGNLCIGISIANLKAAARSQNLELFEWVSKLFNFKKRIPTPLLNVINGGVHAGSDLTFQEFIIIPLKFKSFREKMKAAVEIYKELKDYLKRKFGKRAINVGDEGGFVPPLRFNFDAIAILNNVIEELGYHEEVFLGLDCAANNFYYEGEYYVDEKKMKREGYIDYLIELLKTFRNIIYIEDPFQEEDTEAFKILKDKFRDRIIVGDDLFVTNPKRFSVFKECANGIIIKPNQVGTITETVQTIKLAKKEEYKIIVSHRSGDSEDTFIADFAVGVGADFIKTGAPARSERTAKYNRLLRIEEMI